MIYDYVVTLRNERGRQINITSLLIVSVSAIFFLLQQLRSGRGSYLFLISFILLVSGLAWNWYMARRKKPVSYSKVLMVAGVTWFAMPQMVWIGIPVILLALVEKQARAALEIGFANDRVVINTLFKRRFSWGDFNNILLKDGLLTLDYKNNKLLQRQTLDEEGDADEDEFNAYCSEKMKAAGGIVGR